MGTYKEVYVAEAERMAADLGCDIDNLEQWQHERAMDLARDRILDRADMLRDERRGK